MGDMGSGERQLGPAPPAEGDNGRRAAPNPWDPGTVPDPSIVGGCWVYHRAVAAATVSSVSSTPGGLPASPAGGYDGEESCEEGWCLPPAAQGEGTGSALPGEAEEVLHERSNCADREY
ncbi:hypothetical protein MTO96_051218 [Rhipicephalus appendiculatus]